MPKALRRYGDVLRTPWVAQLVVSSVVARLPIGITSLALVLFLREETGSYAIAGVVAAAFSAGSGFAAPLRARQVDRRGQLHVLPRLVAVYVVALSALLALALAGAPAPVLVLLAALTGSGAPPVSSVLRTLWPVLMQERRELMPAAFALDAVTVELVFVSGPLLVAACAAVASPQVALVLSIVFVVVGTAAFLAPAPARVWEPPAAEDVAGVGPFGALGTPGVLTIVLGTVPLGLAFGICEVALPAFAEAEGSRALAGLLLAVWSFGSLVGGLVYGATGAHRPLLARYLRSAFGLPLALAPLLLAPSIPVMLVLLLPAGACIAPTLSSGNQLIGQVAPAGARTEAYAWPTTSLVIGIGLGNALAGGIVELASWRAAIAVGAAAALAGALVLTARRASLGSPVAVAV